MLEAGKKNGLEMRTATKLVRALGVTLDWLVMGEGDVPTAERILSAVQSAQAAAVAAGAA